MAYKNKIVSKYKLILFIVVFVNFSNAQVSELSVNNEGFDEKTDEYYTVDNSSNGYWTLKDTKVNINSAEKRTVWTINGTELTANTRWLDILNIEHTVISNFRWTKSYRELKPDADMIFQGVYKNVEYNTTAQLPTGIEITINYNFEINNQLLIETYDISKSGRHFMNLLPELRNGNFKVPLHSQFDVMQIIVKCYVGKDNYTTIYTYNWVALK